MNGMAQYKAAACARLARLVWMLVAAACMAGCATRAPQPSASTGSEQAQLEQTMRARHGTQGVQALRDWLDMLQAQKGKPPQQQLQAVNAFWNQAVLNSDDLIVWGETDYWATPLESLGKHAGDCEDFVIGKYFSLLRLGMPVEKLRLIYVRAQIGGAGSGQSIAHMVLGFHTVPTAEPLVLDSLITDIRPASQRPDLTPVFSFNGQGIYVTGSSQTAPADRISRWNGLLARMRQEGFRLP
jgi:predicted transglutaminase-like cysteine proteinase